MEILAWWLGVATVLGLILWASVLRVLSKDIDHSIQFKMSLTGVALWYLFWPIIFVLTIWYVIKLRDQGGLLRSLSTVVHGKGNPRQSVGDQEHPGRPMGPGKFAEVGDGSRKGQVYVVPYIVGDITTHYLEAREGKVHVFRMGCWSLKLALTFPEGEPDFVAPSLPEAVDWVIRDDDFLYLCNPLRVQKLAAWHTDRRQASP